MVERWVVQGDHDTAAEQIGEITDGHCAESSPLPVPHQGGEPAEPFDQVRVNHSQSDNDRQLVLRHCQLL
jgi:hypothetical protein